MELKRCGKCEACLTEAKIELATLPYDTWFNVSIIHDSNKLTTYINGRNVAEISNPCEEWLKVADPIKESVGRIAAKCANLFMDQVQDMNKAIEGCVTVTPIEPDAAKTFLKDKNDEKSNTGT